MLCPESNPSPFCGIAVNLLSVVGFWSQLDWSYFINIYPQTEIVELLKIHALHKCDNMNCTRSGALVFRRVRVRLCQSCCQVWFRKDNRYRIKIHATGRKNNNERSLRSSLALQMNGNPAPIQEMTLPLSFGIVSFAKTSTKFVLIRTAHPAPTAFLRHAREYEYVDQHVVHLRKTKMYLPASCGRSFSPWRLSMHACVVAWRNSRLIGRYLGDFSVADRGGSFIEGYRVARAVFINQVRAARRWSPAEFIRNRYRGLDRYMLLGSCSNPIRSDVMLALAKLWICNHREGERSFI